MRLEVVVPVTFLLLIVSFCDVDATVGGLFGRRRGKKFSAFSKSDSFTTLVTQMNYSVETHTVKTPDKYLLRIHRLPQERPTGKVILIFHGMFCSSIDWILIGPGKSIALLLHDQGYDVWLGNARGNTYSRAHTTIDPDSKEFWMFSWHEIGNLDLPTVVDYIKEKTNVDKMDYIGHSQGFTTFMVMNILRPSYQAMFRSVIGLAPVVFMGDLPNPLLRVLAKRSEAVELLFKALQIYELLPSNEANVALANFLCRESNPTQELCANLLFLAIGPDPIHLNRTLLPQIFNNIPAGISTRQFLHYGHLVNSGRFQHFDYKDRNLAVYNNRTPPDYPLNAISGLNFHLYYGTTDTLLARKDVNRLVDHIKDKNKVHVTEIPNFNHLDYIFASNVTEILYRDLFKALEEAYVAELSVNESEQDGR